MSADPTHGATAAADDFLQQVQERGANGLDSTLPEDHYNGNGTAASAEPVSAIPVGVAPVPADKASTAAPATAANGNGHSASKLNGTKISVAPQGITGPAKDIIDQMANAGVAPGGKVRLTNYVSLVRGR